MSAEETPETGWPTEGEPTAAPEEGEALPAEIPSWLTPLDPDGEALAAQGDEGTGVLEGVSGVVPVAAAVVEISKEAGGVPAAPPAGASEASLFRQVLQEEAPAAAPSRPAGERKMPLWARWLVALLLLGAVGAPIVLGSVTGRPLLNLQPVVSPEVQAFYEQVEQIQPGDAVLVGWDFDPSTEGELGPLAEAVVGHLMQRGARIFVISQLPAGPAVAQQTLETLAETQGKYQYGSHYLNLGYLPGDEAGLRALSSIGGMAVVSTDYVAGKALAKWPVAQGVGNVGDFRLIVELAADSNRVRRWIEQVRSQHEIPMVAGVGAAVWPAVQPYYETEPRQLAGLAGGLPGAAAYESLRQVYLRGQSSMEALAGGVLALVVIVLAGNVAAVLGRDRR